MTIGGDCSSIATDDNCTPRILTSERLLINIPLLLLVVIAVTGTVLLPLDVRMVLPPVTINPPPAVMAFAAARMAVVSSVPQ